ncbi:ribosome recycling factor [Candidatus Peregrinibacteria bacterium CG_4_10_14_0_2_um_filter_43_11]|nr:MAG: ribosome recycling factor [Candidatus Peregrinibacteria bacterium CG_4_10_14_0_2_um_filter_43_11]
MTNSVLGEAEAKFQKAVDHLHEEFGKLQIGRANASLVEGLMIDSYGSLMPLKGVASISIPEATQILIQPWDRNQIASIEKAIRDSNLGLNPQNNGLTIRLTLPPLTEDRRKELVKIVHKNAEEARISVRNSRHEALTAWKQMEKNKEISEDEFRKNEDDLQKKVDEFNKIIEDSVRHKEHDVITV